MNSVLAVDPRRNAKLCWMKHPRFGATRCVRSIRPIQKGEEILVDYGYNTTDNYCPRYKNFSIGRKRSSYKEIVALSLVTKLLW